VPRALRVALQPSGPTERAHPVGRNHGQVIEYGAHRLSDEFDAVEGANSGDHVWNRSAVSRAP
jgi:hypothetical protein